MTFLLGKYQIKSHDYGGYVTQKRVGKQWKEASYFRTLAQAANYLLEQDIHHESTDIVINTMNESSLAISQATLIGVIEGVRDRILEVLDNENTLA